MSTHKYIATFLAFLFFVGLVSCNGGKKAADKETKEVEVLPENIVELRTDQKKLANIEMGAIELRSLSGTFKVNGLVGVSPQNMATVCVPMGGFVKSTKLVPGSAVRKGQTLALIENPEFIDLQQNYLEAKSKLEYAEADYKRQTELYKSDVSSQKNLQQVTSEYRILKSQVKALEQKLTLIGINTTKLTEDNIARSVALVSPIAGYVKTVNANIGKSVSPTDVLFEIVNSDQLFLELTLFEKDAEKVVNGQKIRFATNNETEQHGAVIYQTAKSINADKTYKVYANVTSKCRNLLPGMYVNALIESTTNKVTAVPTEAVVSFEDKDYIFVFNREKVENGKPVTEYKMIQVQKGVTDSGYTEIGLPQDFNIKAAKVVVKGAYNLLSAKKNAGDMAC